jgi:methionyl-tRNA formyltransferase
MRVIFAGGKNVGCGCLQYLVMESQADVVAVFVNPESDTAANRWYPSAAEIAMAYGIPVFSPRSINAPKVTEQIRSLNSDLLVVVYYDQILKSAVIGIPKRGCINLHMALAEEYRGCYPTTWAIVNGEKRTGVTLHYIDEGVDSGDIIAQREIPIDASDTGRDLYEKCTQAGIDLFRETFPVIETGTAPRRRQTTTKENKYYKREFPSRKIDFGKSGADIYNHIRAVTFPPFPPAYFYIGDKKMIIVQEVEP